MIKFSIMDDKMCPSLRNKYPEKFIEEFCKLNKERFDKHDDHVDAIKYSVKYLDKRGHINMENKCLTRKEIEELANQRGYTLYSETRKGDTDNFILHFGTTLKEEDFEYPKVRINLEVRCVDSRIEFRFSYITTLGACELTTGWCSPFEDEEQFRRHEKWLRAYAQQLYRYEMVRRSINGN